MCARPKYFFVQGVFSVRPNLSIIIPLETNKYELKQTKVFPNWCLSFLHIMHVHWCVHYLCKLEHLNVHFISCFSPDCEAAFYCSKICLEKDRAGRFEGMPTHSYWCSRMKEYIQDTKTLTKFPFTFAKGKRKKPFGIYGLQWYFLRPFFWTTDVQHTLSRSCCSCFAKTFMPKQIYSG